VRVEDRLVVVEDGRGDVEGDRVGAPVEGADIAAGRVEIVEVEVQVADLGAYDAVFGTGEVA